jgi:membrane protein DedA with SNARE-associated domain
MNMKKFLLNTDQPLSNSRKIYNVLDYSLWALGLTWMYVLISRVYTIAPLHQIMIALVGVIPLGLMVVAMLSWHKQLEERGE